MSKFSLEMLERCVFPYTKGTEEDPDVVLGATFGEDVAATKVGNDLLLSHVDPIVGAVEGIGRLAVHVACNDIACSGIRPRWIQILVLVPRKEDTEWVRRIMSDARDAADRIGVSIIGGHTGYSSGITRPVVAVTALAPAGGKRIVRTGGAYPGDHILVTGGAGLEGTSILAVDFADEARRLGITEAELAEGAALGKEISIVDEALILAEAGATAMHDVTRGGITETALEIAALSGVCLEIDCERIPLRPIIRRFAKLFDFDPLKMISSGSLVATVPAESAQGILKELRQAGTTAAEVGFVSSGEGVSLKREGVLCPLERKLRCEEDELARMWALYRED